MAPAFLGLYLPQNEVYTAIIVRSHKNMEAVFILNSSKKHRWLYLIGFPIGHGAVDWGGGALWLLGPPMAIAMGLTPFQLGILFAARQIGSGISQLPAGFIGDHWGKRGTFLLITFWWVSIPQLIASGSSDYWIVVSCLTLASAGAAAWHPVAMGVMTQWMPERRAFVLGVHLTGGTVAEITAPLLVGILLAYFTWSEALVINTIPTIILGLIFIRLAPMVISPSQTFRGRSDISTLVRLVLKPGALAVLLAITLHNMALVAFMSMAPLYFQDVQGLSSSMTGLGFSLFLIGGGVAFPFIGHLSDQIGRKGLTVGGLIGGGLLTWVITLVSGEVVIFFLLVIAGLSMLGIRSVIMAMALERIGHRESTVLGLISAVGEGVAALGAVLAGLVGDIDLAYALILAAILSVLAGLVVVPVRSGP
tara:strand:- start:3596 stop:4858 length:1263 start_codon:yes stop_codon:yes gene_type:complete